MDYKKFEQFINERKGSVSIPEVQQAFNCNYNEVKEAFDMAVECELLSYIGGIYYEINEKKPTERTRQTFSARKNIPRKRQNGEAEEFACIKKFIKQRGEITIPALQTEFNLGYGKAREIIRGLVSEKFIEYGEGLTYILRKPTPAEMAAERRAYLERCRRELMRRMSGINVEDDSDNDDDDDVDFSSPPRAGMFGTNIPYFNKRAAVGGERQSTDAERSDLSGTSHKNVNGTNGETNGEEDGGEDSGDYDSVKFRLLDEEIKRRCEETASLTRLAQTLNAVNPAARLAIVLRKIADKKGRS